MSTLLKCYIKPWLICAAAMLVLATHNPLSCSVAVYLIHLSNLAFGSSVDDDKGECFSCAALRWIQNGICDVVLCYSRCWWVEFLMQIAGSGWKQHRMLYNWSQTCLIDMYNQCSKMSGLWYEFNDTEHENKTCQRCNDKKLLSAFYTAAALTSWNVL